MEAYAADQTGSQTVVVRVGQSLDFRTAAGFRGLCHQMFEEGARRFVLDFTDTGILDSTGLGAIFSLYRQVGPKGGRVAFASVSRTVQCVVLTSGAHKIFPQFNTVNEAAGLAA